MKKKIAYSVTVQNASTGETHSRTVIAADGTAAGEAAVLKARRAAPTMVERKYGKFVVLSCAAAPNSPSN